MGIDQTQERKAEKPSKENKSGFQTMQTVIVSSAHAMHDNYSGFIAPLIPFLIEKMGLLKVQAGLFSFVYQGFAILQPMFGYAADKKNLRAIALIAPATTGIAMSLLGVAPSLSIALILCGVGGISSAVMHSILPPIVTKLSGDEISKGMSFWMVGGQIGMLLGPIMVTTVVGAFTLKATPWLMIPGIVIAVLLNILLKDLDTTSIGQENKGNGISKAKLTTIMLPLAAVIVMRSCLRSASISFLPVFLSESGYSIWMVGLAVTLFKGSGVFGTVLSSLINNRLGIKRIFILSLSISGAAMFIFAKTSGAIQIASLAFIGIGSMMMMPVGMATVQNHFTENRSLANGIYLALNFAINAVAGIIVGALYDKFGGQQAFTISAIMAFLGVPFVFLLPKNGKPAVSAKEMYYD